MVRSLFGNSNRKLRSTFWGSPFIPVGTNQTECCLPLTNFSVPSRFQTHATQIRPFLDSNRNGCGISTVNWQIAYHYAFATPTGLFCQMVSTPGFMSKNKKKKKCAWSPSLQCFFHFAVVKLWNSLSWLRLWMGTAKPSPTALRESVRLRVATLHMLFKLRVCRDEYLSNK